MLTHAVARRRSPQRGLSLVELMVGIAVGMFVVAAAATLVASQLHDNRRLLLEVQLQQDMRASMDIITRDLRRAGASNKLADGTAWVWDGVGSTWSERIWLPIQLLGNGVTFMNGRDDGTNGPYGYRLRTVNGVGVVESLLLQGWTPLTDSTTLNVTAFNVQLPAQPEPDIVVSCPKDCPGGGQACWPKLTVRRYVVNISGESLAERSIKRSLSSEVRVRNDQLVTDPANAPGFCPA